MSYFISQAKKKDEPLYLNEKPLKSRVCVRVYTGSACILAVYRRTFIQKYMLHVSLGHCRSEQY